MSAHWPAARAPLRLLGFAAVGLAFGIEQVVTSGPSRSALVAALSYAVGYALAMAVTTAVQRRRLGNLTPAQQRTVVEAVAAGTSPQDPRLARGVLIQAAAAQRAGDPIAVLGTHSIALIATALALVVGGVVVGSPVLLALAGIVLALWQRRVSLPGRRDEERLLRVELARRQARAALRLETPRPQPATPTALIRLRRLTIFVGTNAVTLAVGWLATGLLPHTDVRSHSPAASGYRRVGVVDATTFWVRRPAPDTIALRTTGAVSVACSAHVTTTADGTPAAQGQDVCRGQEPSTGTVFAYLGDSSFHSAEVELDDGTTVRRSHVIDIGVVVPGTRLLVVVLRDRQVEGTASFS